MQTDISTDETPLSIISLLIHIVLGKVVLLLSFSYVNEQSNLCARGIRAKNDPPFQSLTTFLAQNLQLVLLASICCGKYFVQLLLVPPLLSLQFGLGKPYQLSFYFFFFQRR